MCCGIMGETLMARVGPGNYSGCLSKKHVKEMNFTDKAMKGLIYINPEGITEDSDLEKWVGICEKFEHLFHQRT